MPETKEKTECRFQVGKGGKRQANYTSKKLFYLGKSRYNKPVYLEDFSWDCNWYWGGGYLVEGNIHNPSAFYHFEGFFQLPDKFVTDDKGNTVHVPGAGTNLFEGFTSKMQSTPLTKEELWRLCDLFKQFYDLKEAAAVFRHGGHYTSQGRTEQEINKGFADKINKHIETVIIPEIRKVMSA